MIEKITKLAVALTLMFVSSCGTSDKSSNTESKFFGLASSIDELKIVAALNKQYNSEKNYLFHVTKRPGLNVESKYEVAIRKNSDKNLHFSCVLNETKEHQWERGGHYVNLYASACTLFQGDSMPIANGHDPISIIGSWLDHDNCLSSFDSLMCSGANLRDLFITVAVD